MSGNKYNMKTEQSVPHLPRESKLAFSGRKQTKKLEFIGSPQSPAVMSTSSDNIEANNLQNLVAKRNDELFGASLLMPSYLISKKSSRRSHRSKASSRA
jgi:hypothetical protein